MTDEKTEPRIVWADNDETFSADSLEELLDENDQLEPGHTVYWGEAETPDPACWLPSIDRVLGYLEDEMGESAGEECGEWAEGYPEMTPEARKELDEFLDSWARKHLTPKFYVVRNTKSRALTAEDFAGREVQATAN